MESGNLCLGTNYHLTWQKYLCTILFIYDSTHCYRICVFVFYLSRFKSSQAESRAFAISVLLIGIAAILLGRIPSFVAWLPLALQSSFDRLTISMMLGASLFITGVVELLGQTRQIKNLVFALLIALAIGQHFFNANIFRRDWV